MKAKRIIKEGTRIKEDVFMEESMTLNGELIKCLNLSNNCFFPLNYSSFK